MAPYAIKNRAEKNRTDIRAISITNPLFGCQKKRPVRITLTGYQ